MEKPCKLYEGLHTPGLRLYAAVPFRCPCIYVPSFSVGTMSSENSISIVMLVVLSTIFIASIRHIGEAYKKRDHEAIGEGIGTMLFSAVGIVLKLIS
jgi:hypothetical protein